jgi:hypothetical protein
VFTNIASAVNTSKLDNQNLNVLTADPADAVLHSNFAQDYFAGEICTIGDINLIESTSRIIFGGEDLHESSVRIVLRSKVIEKSKLKMFTYSQNPCPHNLNLYRFLVERKALCHRQRLKRP